MASSNVRRESSPTTDRAWALLASREPSFAQARPDSAVWRLLSPASSAMDDVSPKRSGRGRCLTHRLISRQRSTGHCSNTTAVNVGRHLEVTGPFAAHFTRVWERMKALPGRRVVLGRGTLTG